MSSSGSERREFFRIKDKVIVDISKLPSDQTLSEVKNNNASFLIGSIISELDIDNQTLLNKIKRNNSDISAYFEVINKKIEIISNFLLESSPQNSNHSEVEIDLSASGIAIECNETFNEQDLVIVKILLLPEKKGIISIGRVTRRKIEDNKRYLCIDFEEITEADRELIIKHTIAKQLEEARHKKELDD